jgi:hypothetical protein
MWCHTASQQPNAPWNAPEQAGVRQGFGASAFQQVHVMDRRPQQLAGHGGDDPLGATLLHWLCSFQCRRAGLEKTTKHVDRREGALRDFLFLEGLNFLNFFKSTASGE